MFNKIHTDMNVAGMLTKVIPVASLTCIHA